MPPSAPIHGRRETDVDAWSGLSVWPHIQLREICCCLSHLPVCVSLPVDLGSLSVQLQVLSRLYPTNLLPFPALPEFLQVDPDEGLTTTDGSH